MYFDRENAEDVVVKEVKENHPLAPTKNRYNYDGEDFGLSEDDLPEENIMDNEQEVLENIQTRKVTEERQKIVTITKVNKFAIVGIVVGVIVTVCGICVVAGLPAALGLNLDMDSRLGYVLAVMGAYMFCSFGMHVKQNEFQVETYTVEKEIPVEGIPVNNENAKEDGQKEKEINTKVDEMAEMFQKLAALTSDLEEKIMQRESAELNEKGSDEQHELVAQAAASAVLTALREER
jgi:hypothetical protein